MEDHDYEIVETQIKDLNIRLDALSPLLEIYTAGKTLGKIIGTAVWFGGAVIGMVYGVLFIWNFLHGASK